MKVSVTSTRRGSSLKSIISDDVENICYLCGRYRRYEENFHEHHIFEGTGRRKISDKHGLLVHLCMDCHKKLHDTSCPEMQYLHEVGQKVYEEKIGTRDQFRQEFIRSYL